MTKTKRSFALLCIAAAAALVGCATPVAGSKASITLAPTKGNTVEGNLMISQVGNHLLLTGEVRGLKPNAQHGFHVHEKGDCSSANGSAAGGHFNPHGVGHGHTGHGTHHAGDLPNLQADAQGVAIVKVELAGLSLQGEAGILQRSVIVHSGPDDYKSQPSGNSGARMACGIIQAS